MDRKQLYSEVTSLKLQEEIKARYGKNYTQVSNEGLQAVIEEAINLIKKATCTAKKPSKKKDEHLATAFATLLDILNRKRILLDSEIRQIKQLM